MYNFVRYTKMAALNKPKVWNWWKENIFTCHVYIYIRWNCVFLLNIILKHHIILIERLCYVKRRLFFLRVGRWQNYDYFRTIFLNFFFLLQMKFFITFLTLAVLVTVCYSASLQNASRVNMNFGWIRPGDVLLWR